MTKIDLLLIFALCALSSAGLTYVLRNVLLRRAILDNPNERSMHAQAVPRGGGWALSLIAAITLAVLSLKISYTIYAPLFLGVVIIAAISWLDDLYEISALARLVVQAVAALLGMVSLYNFSAPISTMLPFWLLYPCLWFIWLAFMNFYNFMDGIDGITGTETLGILLPIIALGVALPLLGGTAMLATALSGAALGFLFLNWHPAKIFMGDVGSVPLGYLIGFALFATAAAGYPSVAITLPLYYLADAGITLGRRIMNGEKFWQAHRSHFYQRSTVITKRHDKTCLWIALCNLGLWGIALLEVTVSQWLVLLAPLPVALLLFYMQRKSMMAPEHTN